MHKYVCALFFRLRTAVDRGIDFMDNCWDSHDRPERAVDRSLPSFLQLGIESSRGGKGVPGSESIRRQADQKARQTTVAMGDATERSRAAMSSKATALLQSGLGAIGPLAKVTRPGLFGCASQTLGRRCAFD